MKLFEKNVGKDDRNIRLALALVLVAAGIFFLAPPITYIAFFLALVLALTGYAGTCGAYSLLGINTAEKKSERKASRKK